MQYRASLEIKEHVADGMEPRTQVIFVTVDMKGQDALAAGKKAVGMYEPVCLSVEPAWSQEQMFDASELLGPKDVPLTPFDPETGEVIDGEPDVAPDDGPQAPGEESPEEGPGDE